MYISPSMQKGLQQSTNNMETRYFHILPFSHTFRRILLRILLAAFNFTCSFTPALLILIWLSFDN